MTVKAFATVKAVQYNTTTPTHVDVFVSVAGIAAGNPINASIMFPDVDPTILAATWELDVKQAVKDYLTANHSYSWTPIVDIVRLVGALL